MIGRVGYQFEGSAQGNRGPWNAEKLWHPQHAGQPAWHVPPVANIADGPSGLTYYPGTGLSPEYEGHFFLADFRGAAPGSGIRSFAVKPKGAGFELVDSKQFVWDVLATDVDFGPDGALYISDWMADYLDAQNFLSVLLHARSPLNSTGYANPLFDGLCDRADAEADPIQRALLYRAAEPAQPDRRRVHASFHVEGPALVAARDHPRLCRAERPSGAARCRGDCRRHAGLTIGVSGGPAASAVFSF